MQQQVEPSTKPLHNWHSRIAKLKSESRLRMLASVILIFSWAGAYPINHQSLNNKPSMLPCLFLAASLIIFLACQIKARGSDD